MRNTLLVFFQYLGGFLLGLFVALVVAITLLVTVDVPGPGDQQAGFDMAVFFFYLPLMVIVFGSAGIFAIWLLRKR